MGGEGGDAKGPGYVPPLGVQADHGGDRYTWGGRGVGIPPVVVALEAAVLNSIMDYIRRRQASIAEEVACCPVYNLCVEAERRPGTIHRMIWWDQDVVNESEEYTETLCTLKY